MGPDSDTSALCSGFCIALFTGASIAGIALLTGACIAGIPLLTGACIPGITLLSDLLPFPPPHPPR